MNNNQVGSGTRGLQQQQSKGNLNINLRKDKSQKFAQNTIQEQKIQQIELLCQRHLKHITQFQIGINVPLRQRPVCDLCEGKNNCIFTTYGLQKLQIYLKDNSIQMIINQTQEEINELIVGWEIVNKHILEMYEYQMHFIKKLQQQKEFLSKLSHENLYDITLAKCGIIGELISENSTEIKQQNIFNHIKFEINKMIEENANDLQNNVRMLMDDFKQCKIQFQQSFKQPIEKFMNQQQQVQQQNKTLDQKNDSQSTKIQFNNQINDQNKSIFYQNESIHKTIVERKR